MEIGERRPNRYQLAIKAEKRYEKLSKIFYNIVCDFEKEHTDFVQIDKLKEVLKSFNKYNIKRDVNTVASFKKSVELVNKIKDDSNIKPGKLSLFRILNNKDYGPNFVNALYISKIHKILTLNNYNPELIDFAVNYIRYVKSKIIHENAKNRVIKYENEMNRLTFE